ncbi:hypothetical protein VDG1235_1689 [Verrucomicrobiia bacterium DG1235]|nr:hypothetical protein VDG1235_1689 [Verrucomicrobiae bacterium DG1235]
MHSAVKGVAKKSFLGRTVGRVISFFAGNRVSEKPKPEKPKSGVAIAEEETPQFPEGGES